MKAESAVYCGFNRPPADQVGKHGLAQGVEGAAVAEEERLLDRHRLDDLGQQPLVAAVSHAGQQFLDGMQAVTAGHGQQARFHEVGLVVLQLIRGTLAEDRADVLEAGAAQGHAASP